ncbi:MAG: hypothetical protein V2A58_01980 [Planctomycetota bacterium]
MRRIARPLAAEEIANEMRSTAPMEGLGAGQSGQGGKGEPDKSGIVW